MTPNELAMLTELERVSELRTPEQIDVYASIAQALPESDDPECLRRMLRCLSDVDAGEVQYELVEACERFPMDTYLAVLIEESKTLSAQAPQWLELLCCSILNSDQYVGALRRSLAHANLEAGRQFRAFIASIARLHPVYEPILKKLQI